MKCSLEPYMSRPWRRGLLYSSSSLNSKLFFFQATQFEEEKKKKRLEFVKGEGLMKKEGLVKREELVRSSSYVTGAFPRRFTNFLLHLRHDRLVRKSVKHNATINNRHESGP